MAPTCVVHLASGSLGPDPTARFAQSLGAFDAGAPYQLLVVFNGVRGNEVPEEFARALGGLAFERMFIADRVLDLEAYRLAARQSTAETLCLMNSGARILADGWLRLLAGAAQDEAIGVAGASGSWESAFSSAPLALRAPRLVAFRRFPNPHLRTNAVAISRELLLDLDWPVLGDKLDALKFESGRRSLTRQVARRGLRTVVVGRDGRTFDPSDWATSATFRAGSQANLLVGDNRTDDYTAAEPAERLRLARMAWGRRAAGDLSRVLFKRPERGLCKGSPGEQGGALDRRGAELRAPGAV